MSLIKIFLILFILILSSNANDKNTTYNDSIYKVENNDTKESNIKIDYGASIQALATIVAVIVGYFLSIITTKKTWEIQKIQQTREMQLKILIEVLKEAQNTIDSLNNFLNEYSKYKSINFEQINEITNSHIKTKNIKILEQIKSYLQIKQTELKMLKLKDTVLILIIEFIKLIDNIIIELNKKQVDIQLMDKNIRNIKTIFNKIIDISMDGLYG